MIVNLSTEKTPLGLFTKLKTEASNIVVKNEAGEVKESALKVLDKMIDFMKVWETSNKESGPQGYANAAEMMSAVMKQQMEAIKKNMIKK